MREAWPHPGNTQVHEVRATQRKERGGSKSEAGAEARPWCQHLCASAPASPTAGSQSASRRGKKRPSAAAIGSAEEHLAASRPHVLQADAHWHGLQHVLDRAMCIDHLLQLLDLHCLRRRLHGHGALDLLEARAHTLVHGEEAAHVDVALQLHRDSVQLDAHCSGIGLEGDLLARAEAVEKQLNGVRGGIRATQGRRLVGLHLEGPDLAVAVQPGRELRLGRELELGLRGVLAVHLLHLRDAVGGQGEVAAEGLHTGAGRARDGADSAQGRRPKREQACCHGRRLACARAAQARSCRAEGCRAASALAKTA
mmetsp:Transcript_44521/g.101164  ORF Transcript_44521/g.101164 Transcript_44521/m.101164 type:complete len:311 (+) Transcript_44521:62-994(+)